MIERHPTLGTSRRKLNQVPAYPLYTIGGGNKRTKVEGEAAPERQWKVVGQTIEKVWENVDSERGIDCLRRRLRVGDRNRHSINARRMCWCSTTDGHR